jgi:hypothetical protein
MKISKTKLKQIINKSILKEKIDSDFTTNNFFDLDQFNLEDLSPSEGEPSFEVWTFPFISDKDKNNIINSNIPFFPKKYMYFTSKEKMRETGFSAFIADKKELNTYPEFTADIKDILLISKSYTDPKVISILRQKLGATPDSKLVIRLWHDDWGRRKRSSCCLK